MCKIFSTSYFLCRSLLQMPEIDLEIVSDYDTFSIVIAQSWWYWYQDSNISSQFTPLELD